jgi:dimethylhistidine N-methyltransferase
MTSAAGPEKPGAAPESSFARDVREGLGGPGAKHLPPRYFYDDLGSILFDAITRLPEYGIWRAEQGLLQAHAAAIARACPVQQVVELGSGSASKTRLLLDALLQAGPLAYCGIDISAGALAAAHGALGDLPGLAWRGIEAEYAAGLAAALQGRRPHERVLVLFLGSSLGNFDPAEAHRLLAGVRATLRPGDALLLGTDLVKPEPLLLAAYDDALGVTAAFNRNLLVRMNRELDAAFMLPRFRHRVRFDQATRNLEMHLESCQRQDVAIPGAGLVVRFDEGETIHTESSHKYELAEIDQLATDTGFTVSARWVDDAWGFASNLLVVA